MVTQVLTNSFLDVSDPRNRIFVIQDIYSMFRGILMIDYTKRIMWAAAGLRVLAHLIFSRFL